jgi:hypothetical protein
MRAPAALLLSCGRLQAAGDEAMRETKFPGMVTAGGGTSGQVMARSAKPKPTPPTPAARRALPAARAATPAGAGTGGTVTETGQGPSSGVSAPSSGTGQTGGPEARRATSGNNPANAPAAGRAPQPPPPTDQDSTPAPRRAR